MGLRTYRMGQYGSEPAGPQTVRATQEWFAGGVKLLQLQQRNAEFVQGWTADAVEALREQSEHNVKTAEAFARSAYKQQESLRSLSQNWARPSSSRSIAR